MKGHGSETAGNGLPAWGQDLRSSQATAFLLEHYFAGHTVARGLFEDRFGRLRRMFAVSIEGTWDPVRSRLVLTEDFTYDDGASERRVWTIDKTGSRSYIGTADGVIGTAWGETHGRMVTWTYDFALIIGGLRWRVRFDDRMYLFDGGVMLNRARVSKFGLTLGTLTIAFARLPG